MMHSTTETGDVFDIGIYAFDAYKKKRRIYLYPGSYFQAEYNT